MNYQRNSCIPQIVDGKLVTEDLENLTVEKCDLECFCDRRKICIKLINLLDCKQTKIAEQEYKKFYK